MKRSWLIFAMALCLAAWSPLWATDVTFNVNMSVQDAEGAFDPETNIVVVRGTFNGWAGNTHQLSDQGQGIYSGTFGLDPGNIEYKFVIAENGWENTGPNNRMATVGETPLILPVVWFSNDSVITQTDDFEVLFRVDMSIQDLTNNFDPATDWVIVRGGHDSLGQWGGAIRLTEEALNPGVYSRRIQFPGIPTGQAVEYKFVYLRSGSQENDSTAWEQVPHLPNGNRRFAPVGDEPDNFPQGGNGYREINPELVYYSDVGPDDIITQDLTAIFSVEDTPLMGVLARDGYVVDVQTHTDTVRQVDVINFAGGFLTPQWPWGNFPPEANMYDNGVAPDLVAGDHVWTGQFLFAAGTARQLEYKYGANGFDNEAGFARNHVQFLDDSQPTYRMPIDCWGSPDTLFTGFPCVISSADDRGPAVGAFDLAQNFPNPFNPTTTIAFNLNYAEVTTLKVTDLLGREVSVTELGRLNVGRHDVSFDGSNLATGLYFYTLETPSMSMTRKMLLLK